VLAALDLPYDRFCFACFDGRYPVPVPYDTTRHKFILEDSAGLAPVRSQGESHE
jgi:glutamine phosphoribosylpyrophosphate amidotransferase